MARRRYSDAEKGRALATLDANDGDYSRASQVLGIPRVTLICWDNGRGINNEVSQLRHHEKKGLADALECIAWDLVELLPSKTTAAGMRDIVGALSIAVEKMQLLRGDPTAISESRNREMTDEERAERVTGMLDRARSRRAAAVADDPGAGGARLAN